MGEINAAKKNLSEYITAEEERIASLETSLINLDGAMKLHEIQIDPNLIAAKRVNNAKKYLPHGGYQGADLFICNLIDVPAAAKRGN